MYPPKPDAGASNATDNAEITGPLGRLPWTLMQKVGGGNVAELSPTLDSRLVQMHGDANFKVCSDAFNISKSGSALTYTR